MHSGLFWLMDDDFPAKYTVCATDIWGKSIVSGSLKAVRNVMAFVFCLVSVAEGLDNIIFCV